MRVVHRLPVTLAAAAALCLAACDGAQSAAGANRGDVRAAATPARGATAPSSAPRTPTAALTLPALTALRIDQPMRLAANADAAAGATVADPTVGWSSADPSIATIDASGLVTPLRAGFTTVTASRAGIGATGTISVRGALPLPTRSRYVGTNLAGIAYYAAQFPFADLMKSSGGWSSRDERGTGGAAFPAVTADGYPAALDAGQHALAAVAWAGSHHAIGRYVVLWDGDGSISFPLGNARVAEQSRNRIALDVTDADGPLWVSIDRTRATDPVRNLRFLWPGTEATYREQPFNPAFIGKIAPFSMLRFMDWGVTNGSPVVEWADRAHVSDLTYATPAGVPIEVMIDLANSLHVDPWFCIPHQASDDYVRRFAELLHARLDPGLRPHIEYSNEVWNGSFPQSRWAVARSLALGLDSPAGQPALFYAVRAVQMFKIMQGAYGPADRGRLVRVLAGQAAWDNFLTHALAYRDTAANADVMAIAPYFGAPGADDTAQVAASVRLGSDQVVDQMLGNIRGEIKSWMTRNAALARRHHLLLKAYESGPANTTAGFPADRQDAMLALFAAAHDNPRMKAVFDLYYTQWVAAGGDTMLQYNDIGGWSKWGLWGALQDVTQDPKSAPKYMGLIEFIAAHPTP